MTRWHEKLYNSKSASKTINSTRYKKLAQSDVKELISLLNLDGTENILDAPSGTARHVTEFSKRGYTITGIDINPELLKIGKSLPQNKKIKLIRRNLNNLTPFKRKFDVTLNLFTSIGYFETDKKNEAVIKQLFNTLKPGGRLVVDTINGARLLNNFSPRSWVENKNFIMGEVRNYDKKTRYNEAIQFFVDLKDGSVDSHYHRIRIYRATELVRILKKCGAKTVKTYSDFKGTPFNAKESMRMVLVATI